MVGLFKMVINVRVLTKNIIGDSAAESRPANKTYPEPFTLVAFLAELNDGRLLVVAAEGTGLFGPFLKAGQIKIVPA